MIFFLRRKDNDILADLSEEDLAQYYANGKQEALEELISRCKSDLFSFLLALVRNYAAADDLFQDTFLKFALNPERYKPKQKFRSWLFTVARNAAMDYFRKKTTRNEISLSVQNEDGKEDNEGYSTLGIREDASLSPDARIENNILGAEIRKAIDSLPYEQREIFYLRNYSGLSFKEISEITKVPLGTLLARMSRATSSLRNILEKKGFSEK